MRITEPFVKISYVLWLLDKGATNISVSVDGAESDHEIVAQRLLSGGYTRYALPNSKVSWTGRFSKSITEVVVWSKPGIDIVAHFPHGKILVAECKGEPTLKGMKSGLDLTSFYSALGQLIVTADDEVKSPDYLELVMPDTERLKNILIHADRNIRFNKLGINLVLVDESGTVRKIPDTK